MGMADYPTIDPRAFGGVYNVPNAIRRLPVDLLRTALVTRRPDLTKQAMVDYRASVEAPGFTPAQLLPQRLMFQQHKSAEVEGVNRPGDRPWNASAESFTRAVQSVPGISASLLTVARTPERVPTYDEARAANARGAQAMPIPEVAPIPEGIMLRTRPLRERVAPPMQAYGDELADAQNRAAAEAAFRSTNAMRSIALAQAEMRRRLGR
jgi:hypothetical protein